MIVTALYPPDLYGSSTVNGKRYNVFGCIAYLSLTAKVKSLSAGVSVLEVFGGRVNLGLCAIVNGKEVVCSRLFGISVRLRTCCHFSKVRRSIKSVNLLGYNGNHFRYNDFVVVVIIGNTAEVVCTCFGDLKCRDVRRVLGIFAGGLYYNVSVCIEYTNLTVIVTALYPPNLYCSRTGGCERYNILCCITNLSLTAKIKSLSASVSVLKVLSGSVNLSLGAVMDGEEVVGSCLLRITVYLYARSHCLKVRSRIQGMYYLSRSRIGFTGYGNFYLMVVIIVSNATKVISTCFSDLKCRNIRGVLGIFTGGLYYKLSVGIKYTNLAMIVTTLYPPDLYGRCALNLE